MVKQALVIDDEEPLRDIICKVLEHMGIASLTAANGEDAIELCHNHHETIGLIILDMNMPGKNGKETYAGMLPFLQSTEPLIFMSGYDVSDIIDELKIDAPWVFLQKPFTISMFQQTVNKVIELKN